MAAGNSLRDSPTVRRITGRCTMGDGDADIAARRGIASDCAGANQMVWKLVLAYLLALPAVLWVMYRCGQVLGESSSQDSMRARGYPRRYRH